MLDLFLSGSFKNQIRLSIKEALGLFQKCYHSLISLGDGKFYVGLFPHQEVAIQEQNNMDVLGCTRLGVDN